MSGSVDELPLAAAFARGLDVFTRSQSGDADADTIAAGTAAMRHAVTRVDVEGLLSPNETGDDFPTENLKFLMATWYLAELVSRSHTFDPSSRLTCLVETSSLYEQFLTQCEQHEMLGDAAKIVRARGVNGDRPDPATAREEKVQRFKRERLINEKLLALDKSQFERRRVALAEADWDDEDPEDPGSGVWKTKPKHERSGCFWWKTRLRKRWTAFLWSPRRKKCWNGEWKTTRGAAL